MFKNALFLKIILVFTLPALGMMYFSTILVYEKIQTLSHVTNIQKNVHYFDQINKLINALNDERSIILSLKNPKQQKNHQALQEKIEATQVEYHLFLDQIPQVKYMNKSLFLQTKEIQKQFYSLELLRESIQNSHVDHRAVIKQFSHINRLLLSTLYSIKPIDFSTEFNTKLVYLADLLILKEHSDVEEILTNELYSSNKISNTTYNQLLQNYTIQDIYLKKFLLNASISELDDYSDEISLSLIKQIQKIRDAIKNRDISNPQELSLLKQKNEALHRVYDFVFLQLDHMSQKIAKKAKLDQILSLSFLFVSFVTLISLLFVLKNIIFNEQKSYKKLNKQQEVYKLLSATNMFLLTIDNEKKLYKEICKLISLTQSMSFGFVYKVGKQGTSLIAQEGELKKIIDLKLQQEENNDNLITKAINTQSNIIVDSFKTQQISILNDISEKFNLQSAAAFPIKRFEKIVAVLVLYSNEDSFFDTEIEILFNNMINDMTHKLEKLKYEKARIQQEQERKIASYAFESNEPMIITNQSAHIIKANQAFCNVMGYTKKEIIGRNPNIFKSKHHDKLFYNSLWNTIHTTGSWSGEIYNTMKNKQLIPLRSTITAIKNSKGIITHYLAQYIDISEQIDKQKVLEYQASHDNLTGLPNRLLLLDRIERAITKVERHKIVGGLIFIDLDNFKEVNDTLGHEIGDKLLIMVAKKINDTIRQEDTIARIGGDEFIVLADNIGNNKDEARINMQHLTKKIKLALNSILEIDGHKNISTPSIGVTLFSDSSISINDLIKQADTAMYAAKKQGKNTIEFFN